MAASVVIVPAVPTSGMFGNLTVLQLIEEHIDELEDRYIAEHHLENPAKRLGSQEMRRKLGLDN